MLATLSNSFNERNTHVNAQTQTIRAFVNALFVDKFDINLLEKGLGKENFFGKRIKIYACDLVYVFFEVEKKFSISLEKDVQDPSFYTLDGLTEIIGNRLVE
ncbi:peptide maturation system acyl carrier-related protein [Halodesulfovibrio aestuarii]|uniref:Peptide maturation system acyl carrier-related protein n=1 Tax=Halodesulfovibrio aestuarii TaxID=126333 RepID=A0A8G2FH05_9BACT|nr:peptide maturation system acyl carrier-related protein [Halodesulfovibrio aestuarii]